MWARVTRYQFPAAEVETVRARLVPVLSTFVAEKEPEPA